jgi:23S rRNA G2069 N7-methylase RlmK/C1962 C5-methylase RlmI
MVKVSLIRTNLRRYTFESPKIKEWVESRAEGNVLNLFAGKTLLNLNEVRNDVDESMNAIHHKDALDFVKDWNGEKFDTIILDPPYAYRKSMEMYNGNYTSKFKLIADNISRILKEGGQVISFGYHSTFMGNKRGFKLKELCVFAHGGAQHCTIGLIEIAPRSNSSEQSSSSQSEDLISVKEEFQK